MKRKIITDEELRNVRCKECHSEEWVVCWTGPKLEVYCPSCKDVTEGEGNKL